MANESLTIVFAITGASRIASAFTAAESGANKSNAAMQRLNASINSTISAYQRLIAVQSRAGGAARAVNAPAGTAAARASSGFPSGPFQMQQKLAEAALRANSSGSWRAQADVHLAQARNQKQIDRVTAPGKTLGSRVFDVLKTSRIGFSGGKAELMPLAGKMFGLLSSGLGPEIAALTGPIGLVVGASVAAATGIWEMTKASAAASQQFTSFQMALGSSGQTTAALRGLAAGSGLSTGAMAGMADSLQSSITSDPLARVYAGRMGVQNYGGAFGSQDYGSQLQQVIDGLRKIPDMQERIREARELRIPDAVALTLVSPRQKALDDSDNAFTKSAFSDTFNQNSIEFNKALARVDTAFTNLMAALSGPAIQNLTDFLNTTATGINVLNNALQGKDLGKALWIFGDIVTGIGDALTGNIVGAAASFGDAHKAISDAANSQIAAINKNTDATNANTAKYPNTGVFGKGERLNNALPSTIGYNGGYQLHKDIEAGGLRLGYF